MRTLTSTNYTNYNKTYEVSAKSLKKGDSVWIGERVYIVKSNKKDHDEKGRRNLILGCGTHNKKDEVRLSVPSKLVFRVTKHSYNRVR